MRNFRLRIGDCRLRIKYPKGKMIADRRGYSLTSWAVFFGFIMVPIMALGIELGRYFYARAEVAKAADAAALAAATEINQRIFEASGDLSPTSKTWVNAQTFASMNNAYLARYGVNALVTGIAIDAGKDTVSVQVSANLDRLFPSITPNVEVSETGYAQIRGFTH
jgi:Flp pilus assembly protein TadG